MCSFCSAKSRNSSQLISWSLSTLCIRHTSLLTGSECPNSVVATPSYVPVWPEPRNRDVFSGQMQGRTIIGKSPGPVTGADHPNVPLIEGVEHRPEHRPAPPRPHPTQIYLSRASIGQADCNKKTGPRIRNTQHTKTNARKLRAAGISPALWPADAKHWACNTRRRNPDTRPP